MINHGLNCVFEYFELHAALARFGYQRPLARKILAFCNTVHEALEFTALLSHAGIAVAHYNAHTAASERQEILNSFQRREASGGIRVLVTVARFRRANMLSMFGISLVLWEAALIHTAALI